MAIKTRVSDRDFLGGDDIMKATGARYSLVQQDGVDDKGKPKYVSVEDFDFDFSQDGPAKTAFAIFGYHTKVGNVANTILNHKDAPGTLQDAANAIKEFIQGVKDGLWREPGVAGPRYDVAVLAKAIAAVTGKPEAEYSAKMDWRVDQRTGGRVAAGADGTFPRGAISYPAFAMRNKAVAAKYAELGGVTGKEVEVTAL